MSSNERKAVKIAAGVAHDASSGSQKLAVGGWRGTPPGKRLSRRPNVVKLIEVSSGILLKRLVQKMFFFPTPSDFGGSESLNRSGGPPGTARGPTFNRCGGTCWGGLALPLVKISADSAKV